MRFFSLFVLLTFSFALSNPTIARAANEKSILVSHDFTEVLTQALTKDTDIEVVRVIPPNYSPDVHTSYLKKHWQQFSGQVRAADSAIYASAFWPEDPLYPAARKANIRIVPIDLARPLDNSRAGIPVTTFPGSSESYHFLWNSPGSCGRMSDILASDLTRLYPKQAQTITKNLDTLKRELFKIRTSYEVAFGELEAFEAIALTTDYIYLTDEFGINMVDFLLKPEHRWIDKDLTHLSQTIQNNDIAAVICKWQPGKDISQKIITAGAKIVVLQPFKRQDSIAAAGQIVNYYKKNLSLLLAGLQE